MTAIVSDARPPIALIRVLNPIMRTMLRTPLGWIVRPFALLEFRGRHSGRRFQVPVGWHDVDGETVVFTPASWRNNFDGELRVIVRYRGRTHRLTGSLVTDPEAVAATLRSLSNGSSLRKVGIAMPKGHAITAADVMSVDRAMIRFRSSDA
ncbi:MAG: hypothetical protein QOI95_985 [Acidimicrobiaceae bacterium]|jgi:hypothetical protein